GGAVDGSGEFYRTTAPPHHRSTLCRSLWHPRCPSQSPHDVVSCELNSTQRRFMNKAALVCALAATAALAACSKGETYDSRGEVDSAHDTTRVSMPDIH